MRDKKQMFNNLAAKGGSSPAGDSALLAQLQGRYPYDNIINSRPVATDTRQPNAVADPARSFFKTPVLTPPALAGSRTFI